MQTAESLIARYESTAAISCLKRHIALMCSSLMSSWSFSIARMVIDRCCRVDGPPLSTLLNDDAISQRALATSEMVAGPKMQLFLAEVCLSGEAACLQLLDSFQDGRGGLGLCITYYMMLSGENYRCEHTQSLKDCLALPRSSLLVSKEL